MCTTFQHIYEAVIGVTNRGGFGREAHAPPLNSVSISRADPITPLVAPLKGLPFSTLVLYVPRKNEAFQLLTDIAVRIANLSNLVPPTFRYKTPSPFESVVDRVETISSSILKSIK